LTIIAHCATKIESKICDKIFSKNCDLEVHIKTAHKPMEWTSVIKFLLKMEIVETPEKNQDNSSLQKTIKYEISDLCEFDLKDEPIDEHIDEDR
jgi:hypothetical protein